MFSKGLALGRYPTQVTNLEPDRLITASPPECLMNSASPLDERERVEKVSDLVRLLARKPNRFMPFDGAPRAMVLFFPCSCRRYPTVIRRGLSTDCGGISGRSGGAPQ